MRLRDWLHEVRVTRVKPGDVIVLRTKQKITREQADAIREHAKDVWPDNQVAVLPPSIDVEVHGVQAGAEDPVPRKEARGTFED